MDKKAEMLLMKTMSIFDTSYINDRFELILFPRTNLYFSLRTVKNETDLKCKIFEWCSRDATKTQPFKSDKANKLYQNTILDHINKILKTSFTREEMELIYQRLGNAIRHNLTIEFVESGYDLEILKR